VASLALLLFLILVVKLHAVLALLISSMAGAWRQDVVEAYRTVVPEGAAARTAEVFRTPPHGITFTGSSTVLNFVSVAGAAALQGIDVVDALLRLYTR